MSEEPLFDPTLKKKKKKKAVAFNEDLLGAEADPTYEAAAEAAASAPTIHEQMKTNGSSDHGKVEETAPETLPDDDFAMFGDLKKKKKKKIPMDLEEIIPVENPSPIPESVPPPVDGETPAADDFDLSGLKKKKKSSKKKVQMDLDAFEKELGAEKDKDGEEAVEEFGEDEDLGENPFAADDSAPVVGINTGKEPWIGSDRDYKYTELLNRFFAALHAANPALALSLGKRHVIAPPQIVRDGNKKSIFANITDICRRMHRQPEHVIAFMLAEMGTTGSVDGSGRLVIKGRFMQKQIENVLRRYIVEYVTCKTCKSPDTILTKENRIYFMSCESCGSRRSVSAIKSGFQAQVGKRKKAVT